MLENHHTLKSVVFKILDIINKESVAAGVSRINNKEYAFRAITRPVWLCKIGKYFQIKRED